MVIYNVAKIKTIGIHSTNNITGNFNNDLFHFSNWSGSKLDRGNITFTDNITMNW